MIIYRVKVYVGKDTKTDWIFDNRKDAEKKAADWYDKVKNLPLNFFMSVTALESDNGYFSYKELIASYSKNGDDLHVTKK